MDIFDFTVQTNWKILLSNYLLIISGLCALSSVCRDTIFVICTLDCLSTITRKCTSYWSSVKRSDTHPRATAVYNACCRLLRKRLCTPCVCSYVLLERNNNRKLPIYVLRRRRQVQSSPVFWAKKQKTICCRPKVAGDVSSGLNVKTIVRDFILELTT